MSSPESEINYTVPLHCKHFLNTEHLPDDIIYYLLEEVPVQLLCCVD